MPLALGINIAIEAGDSPLIDAAVGNDLFFHDDTLMSVIDRTVDGQSAVVARFAQKPGAECISGIEASVSRRAGLGGGRVAKATLDQRPL